MSNISKKSDLEKGIDPNEWLQEAVRKDYEVVNWHGGWQQVFPTLVKQGFPDGRINLKTLTPALAERLVRAEFPRLRKKSAAKVAPFDPVMDGKKGK